jgi:RAB protein geranylgeranyltransferase component A
MNEERLEEYIKAGILQAYDLKASTREKHDRMMMYRNNTRIKATPEEIAQYWKDRLAPDNSKPLRSE